MYGGGYYSDLDDLLLTDQDGYLQNQSPAADDDVVVELAPSAATTGSSGGGSNDQHPPNHRPAKKTRYHRHTQLQIEELESFFKVCPHPDDNQRKELGQRLSMVLGCDLNHTKQQLVEIRGFFSQHMDPLKIKFWFQNKRTHVKAQNERNENFQLKVENDKLRADNIKYRQALANITCLNCGGGRATCQMPSSEEQRLQIENARLHKEINRISGTSKPLLPYPQRVARSLNFGVGNVGAKSGLVRGMYGTGDLGLLSGPIEADKTQIIELAVTAMEELMEMAQAGQPLWMSSPDLTETLNEELYLNTFPRGIIGPKPLRKKSEASRDSAVVGMSQINLVQILMDVDQWMSVFPGIVSTATTLEVLSAGVAGTYNGALQVMTAEFQVPSPLVPTREHYFVRYCKQHPDGTWAVADVSLEHHLRSNIPGSCRRRPSGCLIQELPNGYSKVIWVEHVEVDDRAVHSLYKPLVNSGLGFGAKRWVATLDRQCERLASALSGNITAGEFGLITTLEGRKSMLKLSERMVMGFCTGVGASAGHTWTKISGSCDEDVRVMTRKSVDEPGKPPGVVLSAATSLRLRVTPKTIFDFLRDKNSRSEWDILSSGGIVQEMVRIGNGRDPGNSVSLLRVNSSNSRQSNMLILQETMTDATGSYVIYAPVDIFAMNVVLSGESPDHVAFLPSGFAILPDVGFGGSLITVAFQILVDSIPTAKLSMGSVATVNSLIKATIARIRSCVCSDDNEE